MKNGTGEAGVSSSPAKDRAYRKVVNSWAFYDWANSGYGTVIMTAILPLYYTTVAGGSLPSNTATVYWGYTTTVALLFAAILAPILGAIADFSGIKKRFLLLFTGMGMLFTAFLYFVGKGDWLLASFLFIGASVGFSCSDLFFNSLLPHVAKPNDIDRVSAWGYAFGYIGGGTLLAISILMIHFMSDKSLATRLSFLSVSVWWGAFSVPLFRNVKEPPASRDGTPGVNPVTAGVQRLRRTFGRIRRYRQLFLFLVAFWIYNDGIGTVIRMAVVYGAEIRIGQSSLVGAILVVQFVGIPCAIGFGKLAKHLGAKLCVRIGLIGYLVICIGGYFMETAFHFWILAFLVGIVQGGTQALSRSIFGAMAPKAKSAEFFGFYGMSSKLAGIVGPLMFAVVGQLAGSSRLSILSLVIFFAVGWYLLGRVDVEEGIRVAREEDAAEELRSRSGT